MYNFGKYLGFFVLKIKKPAINSIVGLVVICEGGDVIIPPERLSLYIDDQS